MPAVRLGQPEQGEVGFMPHAVAPAGGEVDRRSPVTITCGGAEPWRTNSAATPSKSAPIMPAKPSAQPARMASTVDLPMAGPPSNPAGSSAGSKAVRSCKYCVITPAGAMIPPA